MVNGLRELAGFPKIAWYEGIRSYCGNMSRLHPDDLETISYKVADILEERFRPMLDRQGDVDRLVDTKEAVRTLGFASDGAFRTWCYRNDIKPDSGRGTVNLYSIARLKEILRRGTPSRSTRKGPQRVLRAS